MTDVISAISSVTDIVTQVFTAMTSNALLVVFLAASLLGVGISVFRKLRGAAGR